MTHPDREIRFTLTETDYVDALRLNIRRAWVTPKSKAVIAVFGLAGLVALGMLLFGREHLGEVGESIAIGGLIGGLFVFVTIPMVSYHILLPGRVKRIFAQQVTLHGEMTVTWTHESIFMGNAAGSGTIAWMRYYGWSEDEKSIILLQSQALFQMLPKRAMSAEQIEDMRQCAFSGGIVRR